MKLIGKRLFIVEDNTQNRVVYQLMMTRNGAQVEFDRIGRDTMVRLRNMEHIDLIILDLMLPHGNDGFDIFNEIRGIPEYSKIPIVAVSAADPSYAIPKAQQMGFSGFIAKPINDDIFPAQILSIINGTEVWYAGERYEG